MKTARAHILALLIALSGMLAAQAAEIRGVLIRVDPDKNQVMLEARGAGVRGAVMSFVLDKDSQILIGQQPSQLNMLAPGKHARIVYETRDGKNVVQVMHVGLIGAILGNPGQGMPALPLDPKALEKLGGLLGKPAQPMAAVPADPNSLVGKLQRVALTDREITVVGPGAGGPETETNLVVPEDTKITRGDKAIKLDELKEGEQVAVHQQKRDGKVLAESIQVLDRGATVGQPGAQPIIGRARQFLQIADQFLHMMEQGGLKR